MKKLFLLISAAALLATSCQDILDAIDDAGNGGANAGALKGTFSVNKEGGTVCFSQGNLQYQISSKTWRFADHQWDYVGHTYRIETGNDVFEDIHMGTVDGSTNEGIVKNGYSGWIDLFGWGTSGNGDRKPNMSVLNSLEYLTGGKDIAGTDNDWGAYNAISNGGKKAGLWRTLTKDEWAYIIGKRKTSSGLLFAPGTVSGVHGLILLPDDWSTSTFDIKGANEVYDVSWTTNNISASDWTGKLEPAGAVFLPCAGNRGNINYPDEEEVGGGTGPEGYLPFVGNYWSSSVGGYDPDEDYVNSAYILYFEYAGNRGTVRADYGQPLCMGNSVRLVADK